MKISKVYLVVIALIGTHFLNLNAQKRVAPISEYQIYTMDDLKQFADRVNSGDDHLNVTVNLYQDINLSLFEDTYGYNWRPIGVFDDNLGFRGEFNGNGFSITNLTINDQINNTLGLFSYLREGSNIHDLNLINANVRGNDIVGSLAGRCQQCIVNNVHVTGSVTSNLVAGGVVGQSDSGTLMNLTNEASVTGKLYAGGIVGDSIYTTFISTRNKGSIAASMKQNSSSGGIAAFVYHATLDKSLNTGSIQSKSDSGGIVGYAQYSDISNSINHGAISGSYYSAGIVANYNGGTIKNAYNTGTVTEIPYELIPLSSYLGGIVGRVNLFDEKSTVIDHVYNIGVVSSSRNPHGLGSLVGRLDDGTITNSFYDSTINTLSNDLLELGISTEALFETGQFYTSGFINENDSIWSLPEMTSENVYYPILKIFDENDQKSFVSFNRIAPDYDISKLELSSIDEGQPLSDIVISDSGYLSYKMPYSDLSKTISGQWSFVNSDSILTQGSNATLTFTSDNMLSNVYKPYVSNVDIAVKFNSNTQIVEPTSKTVEYTPNQTIDSVTLEDGWSWVNPETPLVKGIHFYQASYVDALQVVHYAHVEVNAIAKYDLSLDLYSDTLVYGQGAKATLTALLNGNALNVGEVYLAINDIIVSGSIIEDNGEVTFNYGSELNAGSYKILFTLYSEEDVHFIEKTLTINKSNTLIDASSIEVKEGISNVNIIGSLNDVQATGTINITIPGQNTLTLPVVDGMINATMTLIKGEYLATLTYSGDDNHKGSSMTINIKVLEDKKVNPKDEEKETPTPDKPSETENIIKPTPEVLPATGMDYSTYFYVAFIAIGLGVFMIKKNKY